MGLSGPKVVLVSILIALFLPNLGKFVYFFSLICFDEFFMSVYNMNFTKINNNKVLIAGPAERF